jgi:hypothetical protein
MAQGSYHQKHGTAIGYHGSPYHHQGIVHSAGCGCGGGHKVVHGGICNPCCLVPNVIHGVGRAVNNTLNCLFPCRRCCHPSPLWGIRYEGGCGCGGHDAGIHYGGIEELDGAIIDGEKPPKPMPMPEAARETRTRIHNYPAKYPTRAAKPSPPTPRRLKPVPTRTANLQRARTVQLEPVRRDNQVRAANHLDKPSPSRYRNPLRD